jgi:ankyrin repeat protein
MSLYTQDNRGSTPLHWACYSKSEVALCYLLSWVTELDSKDIEGYTPLHLAVKSVETLKSVRPVRSLLIRGASRNVKDKNGRTPADLIKSCMSEPEGGLAYELRSMLQEPRDCSCLMIKTPLKLMRKSPRMTIMFSIIISLSYLIMLVFIFPCKSSLTPFIRNRPIVLCMVLS